MSHHAVFIAHAEPDRSLALEIAAELRRDGHSTWTYEENGVPGVSYLAQIYSAIRDSDAVVLLLSSHSLESHHVRREAETAYEHQKTIIPVRIGVDHARVQADSIFRMTSGTAVSIAADGITTHDVARRIGEGLQYAELKTPAAVVTSGSEAPEWSRPPGGRVRTFVEAPLRVFATYVRELLAIVTGPKRFAASLLAGPTPLERAAVFLAISVAIAFLLRLPFSENGLGSQILQTAGFSFVLWTLAGAVIWLACRLVGGTGSIERTIATGFYYFGVLEFFMSLTVLALVGTLSTLDPSSSEALRKAVQDGRIPQFFLQVAQSPSTGWRAAGGVVIAGAACALVWLIVGWGGFTAPHGLTARRSAAALAIAALLWLPVGVLTVVAAIALLG